MQQTISRCVQCVWFTAATGATITTVFTPHSPALSTTSSCASWHSSYHFGVSTVPAVWSVFYQLYWSLCGQCWVPSENCKTAQDYPFPWEGSGPPSNTWFPGPTKVLNPSSISIGSAIFAGLTSVTDRPPD